MVNNIFEKHIHIQGLIPGRYERMRFRERREPERQPAPIVGEGVE